jgi:DNA-binding response OmpR family regulator
MPADGDEPHRDVLVVEDDPEINELLGAYARLCGLGYRGALTGAEALAEAGRRAPSLVLLDLMLPDLDGFEICRRLKSDARTASSPVIMLTALDKQESRQLGLSCGAVEYLTKPFDPDRLMAAMRKYAGDATAKKR